MADTSNFRARLPRRGTVFKVLGIGAAVFLGIFLILGVWVYRQSVGKFQLRRLSLPTRVFADLTRLQAGQPMATDDLLEKLDRLGYRETPTPQQAGEFSKSRDGITIFTRGFKHPSGEYPSQAVRVSIKGSAIEAVSAENAALEPELLTSILSDELENRRPVTLSQIPKHLQDAVIVTEDVRFWHHPGVDPLGIFRAVFRNVKSHGVAEGGSTLTQQLVKNYYLTSERTYKRKIIEAFMALILDARYSKQEILEAYLNDIYLGRNRSISILGVGEAARFYFGKPVSEISIAEAAMIAGMIRSPNNYSPFANPEKSMLRRNTVLELMLKNKKIDRATYEQARSSALPRKPFREKTGLGSIPFYVDRVLEEMARDYGVEDVKGHGYQIYTAIDLAAQDMAAKTVDATIQGLEKSSSRLRRSDSPLQGALIHVDVPTGEIRALVGGRNYDQSQFNRALKSKRQVGSLFKPFVFLTAFEPSLSSQNITPATLVSDTRFVLKRRFSADWSPRNYEDHYYGTVTVREALERSLNSASVRIGLSAGIPAILKTAKTLGVQTELDDNPAVILGAAGVPPIEMADAYSTIARQGSRVPLRTIRFVTNDRGRVLSAGDDIKPVQVFPQRDVFLLTHVMRGVVDRGTGARARSMGFKKIAAGKTGTTNDKRDAWFIGFTPQTLALTWIGFDDNKPTGLSGGESAVPMWTRFMNVVTAGQPNADFVPPSGISFAEVDETSGGLAVPQCPRNVVVTEAFKSGTEPANLCPLHGVQQVPMPMVDMFGNPIALDTAFTTDTTGTLGSMTSAAPPPPAPDSQLGGGIYRTDTATATQTPPPVRTETAARTETAPRTETATPPPPVRTDTAPPPSTNTSEPPPPPTNTAPPTNT